MTLSPTTQPVNLFLKFFFRSVASSSQNGCQLPCFQTANCVAYSWFNGVCYLKGGSTKMSQKNSVYSAVMCRSKSFNATSKTTYFCTIKARNLQKQGQETIYHFFIFQALINIRFFVDVFWKPS